LNDEQGNNKVGDGGESAEKSSGPAIPKLFSAKRPLTTGNMPAVKRPSPDNRRDDAPEAPKGPALPSLFSKKGSSGTQRMHAVQPPGAKTPESPTSPGDASSPGRPAPAFGANPAAQQQQPVEEAPRVDEELPEAMDEGPITQEEIEALPANTAGVSAYDPDLPAPASSGPQLVSQESAAHIFGDPDQVEESGDGDGGPSTDVLSAEDVDPSWENMEPEWSEASSAADATPDTEEAYPEDLEEEVFEDEPDDAPTQVVNPEDVLDALEPSPGFDPAPSAAASRNPNPFMGGGGGNFGSAPVPAADEASTNDFPGIAAEPAGLDEHTQSEDAPVLSMDEVSIVEEEEDHTAIDMDRAEILGKLGMSQEIPGQIQNNDFDDEGATQVFNSGVGPAPTAPGLDGIGQNAQPRFDIQQQQQQQAAPQNQYQQQQQAFQAQPSQPQPQHAPAAEAAPIDDFDDEFTAQKTELIQSPFERDLLAPKLRAMEGPTAGQEYFVNGLRVTVGRGENSSVMIADIAMSRTHFELIKNSDDSFVVRDMESANGTLLNGAPIREASLFHGDRIEVGKTILEFQHENAPPRPHRHLIPAAGVTMTGAENPLEFDDQTNLVAMQLDQSTRFFTNVSLFAGLLCIPLCILLVVVSSTIGETKTQEPAEVVVETVEPEKNEAAEAYLQGVEAVRNREWEKARGHFERANKSDDQVDITAQIKRIESEVASKALLEEASAAAKEGEDEKVLGIISKIPRESVYYDEAQRLTRDKRRDEVTNLYTQAQQQITEDKLEEAEQSIAAILELVPNHAGATELKERVDARKAELEELKRKEELAAREKDKSKGNDINFNDPFSSSKKKSNSSSSSLKEGYSHYKRKRFSKAESFFGKQGSKGKKLAADVRTVDSNWSSGSKAVKAKQWSRAVSTLEKARRADSNLGKHHRDAISSELAEAYGGKGLDQLKKKDYINARKSLTQGQKLGKSGNLNDLARGLEREATSLYIQAANKKKTNPTEAAKICRTIMRMVPSSSVNFKKAKRLILEL
jgi:pSer/pThr/pTyr-binding forkhead associated (FHA) protein